MQPSRLNSQEQTDPPKPAVCGGRPKKWEDVGEKRRNRGKEGGDKRIKQVKKSGEKGSECYQIDERKEGNAGGKNRRKGG